MGNHEAAGVSSERMRSNCSSFFQLGAWLSDRMFVCCRSSNFMEQYNHLFCGGRSLHPGMQVKAWSFVYEKQVLVFDSIRISENITVFVHEYIYQSMISVCACVVHTACGSQ